MLTPIQRMIIAIDGPSGAGKSTVARALAQRLGAAFLDTGAMYRAVTWACLRAGVAPGDAAGCGRIAAGLDLHFEPSGRLLVDGQPADPAIRGREVTAAVSEVSAHPGVREIVVADQRQIAAELGDLVAEGRDTTTVVFPAAEFLFYLDASAAERARRRAAELGHPGQWEQVERDLARRDAFDSGRAHSPLRRDPRAVVIETDGLSVEQVVDRMLAHVRSRKA
jgi:cytidylate kinase